MHIEQSQIDRSWHKSPAVLSNPASACSNGAVGELVYTGISSIRYFYPNSFYCRGSGGASSEWLLCPPDFWSRGCFKETTFYQHTFAQWFLCTDLCWYKS